MRTIRDVYRQFSALVWKEDDLYVAKAIQVEVTSQGHTRKEAIENLKEALELYFENEPKKTISSSYRDLSFEKINIQYA